MVNKRGFRGNPGGREAGVALILVLWILTLLGLMAGSFALTMRRDSASALVLKDTAQARALLETGFSLAKMYLKQKDPDLRWLVDGSAIYQLLLPDGSEIRIRLVSEAGKIDLNTAPDNLLQAAISGVTSDFWQQQHLLNCILDWRDADNNRRPHGCEAKDYTEAGLDYPPANKPFQSVDELQLVLDVDAQTFARMRDWVTVYSGKNDVDYNVATMDVLQLIDNYNQANHIQNPALQKRLNGGVDLSANSQSGGNGNTNANTNLGANNTPNPNGAPNANGAAAQDQVYSIQVEAVTPNGAHAAALEALKPQSANAGAANQVFEWKQQELPAALFSEAAESGLIRMQNELTIFN